MKSTANKRAVIVGIFILLGLIFFIAGIFAIGNINNSFVKKIAISTVFDDVNGLQKGNNIWFSGVKIGTVKDLALIDGSKVIVSMNIDEKAQSFIKKDAKAKISADGLIGNKIIVLYGGTPEVPAVESGDKLSIEKTYSTEDMMNTLQENNVNILAITTDLKDITKKISDGQGSMGKLLNDDALYTTMEQVIASLKKASDNTQRLTASLSDYGSKLKQDGTLANDLVTDTAVFRSIRASAANLDQISTNAVELTNNLKTASNDLNSNESAIGILLHDDTSAASLKTTLKNLETSTAKLDENMEALQHSFLLRGFFKKKAKESAKQ
jgi:phospholipid/cholesterol/gamma-HCH transport system substrate-binding protein